MDGNRPGYQKAFQFIRATRTPHTEAQLVAAGDNAEVIRFIFQPGARWSLVPATGWTALEHLTVLSGCLEWVDRGRRRLVRAGESLSAAPVRVPINLTATEPTVILYFCSQPVFHLHDENTRQWRDLAVAVEEKDGYTAEHCQRLQDLAARVGEVMGLSPERQYLLNFAAFLHDIGKVKVPDTILGKPAPLSAEEWVIMRRHPLDGSQMLEHTSLAGAAPIIAQHHERLDGSGYPFGLAGDEILLEAQILAVVDSFDAMTTDRPYRKALSVEQAVAELRRGVGRLYRQDVVLAFLKILDQNHTLQYNLM